mmetsp:Transcript_9560/g.21617  ORF Transcript_9560/g.21617 Transcript_9560/m.21617 type:complete len:92 (+) Transcript_9560:1191-1466(+)
MRALTKVGKSRRPTAARAQSDRAQSDHPLLSRRKSYEAYWKQQKVLAPGATAYIKIDAQTRATIARMDAEAAVEMRQAADRASASKTERPL